MIESDDDEDEENVSMETETKTTPVTPKNKVFHISFSSSILKWQFVCFVHVDYDK